MKFMNFIFKQQKILLSFMENILPKNYVPNYHGRVVLQKKI